MGRISLDLPDPLVRRLEAQSEMLGTSRADLIGTAVEGLLREFEQIDAEEGCPCTCGSPRAHARWCLYRPPPRPGDRESPEEARSTT